MLILFNLNIVSPVRKDRDDVVVCLSGLKGNP